MTLPTDENQSINWSTELRRVLMTYFSESDLEVLCFDLKVDYESLPGDNKSKKVIELILYFSRSGMILELIDRCKALRPNVEWEKLKEAAIQDPFVIKHFEDEDTESQSTDDPLTVPSLDNVPGWAKSYLPWIIAVTALFMVVIFIILQRPVSTNSRTPVTTTTTIRSNSTQPSVPITTSMTFSEKIDCSTSLGMNAMLPNPVADDELQIDSLIKIEAEGVVDRDFNMVMAIYWEDATVIEASSGEEWVGCNEILERYEMLLFSLTFYSLTHDVLELSIDKERGRADAKTTVLGEYGVDSIYEEIAIIDYSDEERWTFLKANDSWRVKNFVFGLSE